MTSLCKRTSVFVSSAILTAGGLVPLLAQVKEPSSSKPAYVLPSAPGVSTEALLTVGDSVNNKPDGTPYRMVGIPDGLGAFDNGDGTFTVLMNHELTNTSGIARDHGARGAFVSKWTIDKNTHQVLHGEDLIKTLNVWDSNPASPTYNEYIVGSGAIAELNRLCSADLPAPTAYYNAASGLGTTARIFMDGEETANGRAFAHVVTGPEAGKSWELPWTGKFAFENNVTNPLAQNKTIVVGLDDSSRNFSSEGAAQPSEVYVWVGNKQSTGSEIEKAGLMHGVLNGVRLGIPGNYDANEGTVTSGERFELVGLSDQTNHTDSNALQAESLASGITQFRRVEDGAFDPNNPNDFYFVTTDQFGAAGFSKLWRLRFDDITNPGAGGTIHLLINGAGVGSNTVFSTGEMFDNITVDGLGRVILQEDVGNNVHLGKVWAYDIDSGGVLEIARHDANLFLSTSAGYIGTQDEETSGVIDVSNILGPGTYLMSDQVHKNLSATDPELTEMGQLLLMKVAATAGIGFDAASNAPALLALGTNQNGDAITITQSGDLYTVIINGQTLLSNVDGVAVTRVFANGYQGEDVIDASGISKNAALFGGNGKDVVIGGSGDDIIDGGNAKDTLTGNAGRDTFFIKGEDKVTDFVNGTDTKGN
jgi:Ca2+-binding RTX toxin-like protein